MVPEASTLPPRNRNHRRLVGSIVGSPQVQLKLPSRVVPRNKGCPMKSRMSPRTEWIEFSQPCKRHDLAQPATHTPQCSLGITRLSNPFPRVVLHSGMQGSRLDKGRVMGSEPERRVLPRGD
jgi:hypothetical protein